MKKERETKLRERKRCESFIYLFIYLFMVFVPTLAVDRTNVARMVGRLVNTEFGRTQKQGVA
jgi:hypothetical protein